MSSHKGETIVVFPHPLQNDVPSFDGMAPCAVSPHLPAMNVGVAVGTICSGIREHRREFFHVGDGCVHADVLIDIETARFALLARY